MGSWSRKGLSWLDGSMIDARCSMARWLGGSVARWLDFRVRWNESLRRPGRRLQRLKAAQCGRLDPSAGQRWPTARHLRERLRQLHLSFFLHEFRPQARHDLRGNVSGNRAAVGNSAHVRGTDARWVRDENPAIPLRCILARWNPVRGFSPIWIGTAWPESLLPGAMLGVPSPQPIILCRCRGRALSPSVDHPGIVLAGADMMH